MYYVTMCAMIIKNSPGQAGVSCLMNGMSVISNQTDFTQADRETTPC